MGRAANACNFCSWLMATTETRRVDWQIPRLGIRRQAFWRWLLKTADTVAKLSAFNVL
jgi:hypothetical protein